MQEDSHQDDGHFSDLRIRNKVVLYLHVDRPQGEWDRVAELMIFKFGESGHPVFRATGPLSRGNAQKQRRWTTYLFTSAPMVVRLKLFFVESFLLIN